jgi:hypothetical protein
MGENDSPPQQEPAAPMEFMPLLLRAAITNFASSCPLSYRCKKTVTWSFSPTHGFHFYDIPQMVMSIALETHRGYQNQACLDQLDHHIKNK